MKDSGSSSRRRMLGVGAALAGGLLVRREALAGEDTPGPLGAPLGPYGERSPFEKAVRWRRDTKTPETGSSFTPLQDSVGVLTPSALHYERHHAGIARVAFILPVEGVHDLVEILLAEAVFWAVLLEALLVGQSLDER